jgi:hypothetical protein
MQMTSSKTPAQTSERYIPYTTLETEVAYQIAHEHLASLRQQAAWVGQASGHGYARQWLDSLSDLWHWGHNGVAALAKTWRGTLFD